MPVVAFPHRGFDAPVHGFTLLMSHGLLIFLDILLFGSVLYFTGWGGV
jgi:hypothetical protein